MAITELILGNFIVKDEVMTTFILKDDGLVYLRTADGYEHETPITVKQFMHGMDQIRNMLDEWRNGIDDEPSYMRAGGMRAAPKKAGRKKVVRYYPSGKRMGRPPKNKSK